MEAIKILQTSKDLNWDYDDEADVLYLSVGKPRPAIGVDIGEGTILRYDEKNKELVGITVIGVKSKLLEEISG